MSIYAIYKATNCVNGKVYIGFDSNWPNRQQTHLQEVDSEDPADGSVFHKALRKYGPDAFTWEIICQSKDGDHLLNEMEGYFIREYNSFYLTGHGYNMTYGGEGTLGRVHTEETRKKISESAKGRKHTKETRRKMSKALKGVPKSKESNEKRSQSLMGHETTKNARKKMSRKKQGTSKYYNPTTNHYIQCRPGTEPQGYIPGGPKHTNETKELLRTLHIGKRHTAASIKKMSRCKTGKQNSMYGKHHTADTRQAISAKTKGRLKGSCWYHHPSTRHHYRGLAGTQPAGYVKGRAKNSI